MIESLIRILGRAGLEFSSEEIRDVLWLSRYTRVDVKGVRYHGPKPSEVQPSTELEETVYGRSQQDPEIAPFSRETRVVLSGIAERTAQRGTPVVRTSVPAAHSLPDRKGLTKAFRPLKRRVPSKKALRFDEERTVSQIADQGIFNVFTRPGLERWLELDLVVEESPSMLFWQGLVDELLHLVRSTGGFRQVNYWWLATDLRYEQPELYAQPCSTKSVRTRRRPAELANYAGNRIIVFVSDCVSRAWHNGRINSVLETWTNKSFITLLQLLPKELWSRCGLRHGFETRLKTNGPVRRNTELTTYMPTLWPFPAQRKVTGIPVISLDAKDVRTWALFTAGINQLGVRGFVFPGASAYKDLEAETVSSRPSPEEKVELFRAVSSPYAWELAVLLSATGPLNLPLMRTIQHVMLPKSAYHHLIEILQSGLIKRIQSDAKGSGRLEHMLFDFVSGTRGLLGSYLPRDLAEEVLRRTSDFVNEHTDTPISFEALLADPNLSSHYYLDSRARPFAHVVADVLSRYVSTAHKAEELKTSLAKIPKDRPHSSIVRFGEIEDMVKSYYPDADLDLIRAAYVYAAQVRLGQPSVGGEPYLLHPVAVAKILAQMKLDEVAVATGLLHRAVEDSLSTLEDIEKFFGNEIARLVDGVTKISKMQFRSRQGSHAENFRKMILAMSRDIRVLLVTLADRLDNMRTPASVHAEMHNWMAQETMEIYAPLAGRLGIAWMETELEDLAFRQLDPENYSHLKARLEKARQTKHDYVEKVLRFIREKLQQYKIRAVTKAWNRGVYDVHEKMVRRNLDFEEVHDLATFRIILNMESECYAVLGLIHSFWRPVQGRYKDYIAMPKKNGYQSLHTTVIGPEGAKIAIQIRTHEMDLTAEEGIAAHWSYKEGKAALPEDLKVFQWLRQMMEWQQDLDDPREFLENVRVDFYPDEVYVFTPKGEVKEFPLGATPLDFAYSIHTEVGHRCVGARVNGKMVTIRYELKTGDSVEIVTSLDQRPSKDWLKYVKSARARTKIRHFLLTEGRERSIQMGRESTEQELKKWRSDLARAEREGEILKIAQEYSFRTEEDLYAAIGYGTISPKVIVTKIIPPQEREKEKSATIPLKGTSVSQSGIRIDAEPDTRINFAKCCNPLPGDKIRGFITQSRGITIHKDDCINLLAIDPQRTVDAAWSGEQQASRVVGLSIRAENRTGLLHIISGVFSSNDSEVVQASLKTVDEDHVQGSFMVLVRDLAHLTRIINALKSIDRVETVGRLGSGDQR